mmetsp:Transcript_32557/g.87405  ORF Transcript_32557/g.87405 Transcript_32557/m.87405 type:complete len:305 (+) Transcript_32557:1629-2543(+)
MAHASSFVDKSPHACLSSSSFEASFHKGTIPSSASCTQVMPSVEPFCNSSRILVRNLMHPHRFPSRSRSVRSFTVAIPSHARSKSLPKLSSASMPDSSPASDNRPISRKARPRTFPITVPTSSPNLDGSTRTHHGLMATTSAVNDACVASVASSATLSSRRFTSSNASLCTADSTLGFMRGSQVAAMIATIFFATSSTRSATWIKVVAFPTLERSESGRRRNTVPDNSMHLLSIRSHVAECSGARCWVTSITDTNCRAPAGRLAPLVIFCCIADSCASRASPSFCRMSVVAFVVRNVSTSTAMS